MIGDLRKLENSTELNIDLCVIGGGAAGITFCREFFGMDARVVLLESGGLTPEETTQALCAVENIGHPLAGAVEGRARIFGGTTTLWGGQSIPLDDMDFEPRSWVPYSGWPINKTDLQPFYRRAEDLMGINSCGYDYGHSIWELVGFETPGFDLKKLNTIFSRFNPIVFGDEGLGVHDFSRVFSDEFKRSVNVEVLLHANATNLRANKAGQHIDYVLARTLEGKTLRVKARAYIICCGGIETARLLLASNDILTCGIGNHNDIVGRFFQEHPILECATIKTASPKWLQQRYVFLRKNNRVFWARLALSEALQRSNQALNCDANIMFDVDEESGIQAAMELYKGYLGRRWPEHFWRNCWRAIKGSPEVVEHGLNYFVRNRWPTPKPKNIRLQAHVEQVPDPSSRILLSHEKDPLGLPTVRVDWRLNDRERDTVQLLAETAASEFSRLGIGDIEIAEWLRPDNHEWRNHIAEGYHHMGTARMAENTRDGVVDKNCRVHGVGNLYISSSAVFPTCGSSNPTLTIIALSIRLADHLKRTLALR